MEGARRWCGLLCVAAIASPVWPAAPDQDIAVRVDRNGSEIVVDVDCPVRAPLAMVWEVLTDYDNMTGYISNLQYSGVQSRVDNMLIVRQKGKATRGPFSFAFDNVRAVDLLPYTEIRSQLVNGTLKASTFTTRIVEGGGLVHIVNSGRYTPDVWVPPLIGPAVIEAETRKQFSEIRLEILRRSERLAVGLDPPPSPLSGAEDVDSSTDPPSRNRSDPKPR
jgi:hypothetical protein